MKYIVHVCVSVRVYVLRKYVLWFWGVIVMEWSKWRRTDPHCGSANFDARCSIKVILIIVIIIIVSIIINTIIINLIVTSFITNVIMSSIETILGFPPPMVYGFHSSQPFSSSPIPKRHKAPIFVKTTPKSRVQFRARICPPLIFDRVLKLDQKRSKHLE